MITPDCLAYYKNWFRSFVEKYRHGDEEFVGNIDLKIVHTERVRLEIISLGKSLGISDDDLRTAELAALLHDIGRFEQYKKYGTYSDTRSVSHAALGLEILESNSVLIGLDDETRSIITASVGWHSALFLPEEKSPKEIFFLKMLRDADKIDILRVVTENYQRPEARNPAIDLDLPDDPSISDIVYEDLNAERLVRIENCRSVNDFKLLQIGWVYDINFPHTYAVIKERNYFVRVFDSLPDDPGISSIRMKIMKRLELMSSGIN